MSEYVGCIKCIEEHTKMGVPYFQAVEKSQVLREEAFSPPDSHRWLCKKHK